MSPRERFYREWALHTKAGGDTSDESWNKIARECGIEPPARQKPAAAGGAVLVPLAPGPFDHPSGDRNRA